MAVYAPFFRLAGRDIEVAIIPEFSWFVKVRGFKVGPFFFTKSDAEAHADDLIVEGYEQVRVDYAERGAD